MGEFAFTTLPFFLNVFCSSWIAFCLLNTFFFKPEDIFINFKERERKGERQTDTHRCERNIDWLFPTRVLNGNGTYNPLARGSTLRPTEPPGRG